MSAGVPLLDDFEKGFLKFQDRAPRTLAEKSVARAEYEHACRLAEIKKIAPKLDLLQALLPALAEAGITLADRTFTTWDGGKTMRIQPPLSRLDDNLHAALLQLGFREIERKSWGYRDDQVTLKHGRSLVVRVDVTKLAPAPAVAAASEVPV